MGKAGPEPSSLIQWILTTEADVGDLILPEYWFPRPSTEITVPACRTVGNIKLVLEFQQPRWHCARLFCCFSRIWLFATPWTRVYQAPLSMRFSRPEHWSGLLCPPPGDPPNPRIEPVSLAAPVPKVGSLPLSHQGIPHGDISTLQSEHTKASYLRDICF